MVLECHACLPSADERRLEEDIISHLSIDTMATPSARSLLTCVLVNAGLHWHMTWLRSACCFPSCGFALAIAHTRAGWRVFLGCSGDSPVTHALCPLASSHPLVVRAASARHEQQPLQEALRRLCPRQRLLSWVKPRRQRCSRRSTMRLTLCS